MLAPKRVFAKVPAVIAPEDHDGVVGQAESSNSSRKPTDIRIRIADAGIVAMDQLPVHGIRRLPLGRHIGVRSQFTEGVNRSLAASLGPSSLPRQANFVGTVQVPVLLGRDQWQMRLEETDGEEQNGSS